jgi:hypothetical protein
MLESLDRDEEAALVDFLAVHSTAYPDRYGGRHFEWVRCRPKLVRRESTSPRSGRSAKRYCGRREDTDE